MDEVPCPPGHSGSSRTISARPLQALVRRRPSELHTRLCQLASAMARSVVKARSTRRCLPRVDWLELELSLAFDEERTVPGLIAARGVAIVPTRLHEIGSPAQAGNRRFFLGGVQRVR